MLLAASRSSFSSRPERRPASLMKASLKHVPPMSRTSPAHGPRCPIRCRSTRSQPTCLHTGKVLIVAGSENDASNNSKGAESYRAAIWDPTGTDREQHRRAEPDLRCLLQRHGRLARRALARRRGHVRLLVHGREPRFHLRSQRRESSCSRRAWSDGRWYATATRSATAAIMAMSPGSLRPAARARPSRSTTSRTPGRDGASPTNVPFGPPLYPRIFLLPNGKVFYTGQGSGAIRTRTAGFSTLRPGPGPFRPPTTRDRSYGSSVILPLLPPSYTPRVMNFGGGSPATAHDGNHRPLRRLPELDAGS